LNSVYFADQNTGWAVGHLYNVNTGIILKTTNGGLNWISQVHSSSYWLSSVHFIDNNSGWVVGQNGTILKTITGGELVGVQSISVEVPSGFSLNQNYPNPFNPVTNLEFGISDLGFVSLKVYDILGKEVATLVNEKLSPGKYKVEFDGSALPSGIYFYRITAGEFTNTKRMMLVK